MRNWIPVRYGAGVQCTVVAAGPPTVVFLGHQGKGGGPRPFRAAGGAVSLHGAEFSFGNGQASRVKTARATSNGWSGRRPNVVHGVMLYLPMDPGWRCQTWKFLQESI